MKYKITSWGRDFLRFVKQYHKLLYYSITETQFIQQFRVVNKLAIDYECVWGTSPIEELIELDRMDLKSGRKV